MDSSRLGHTSQFIEGFLCFNQDIKNKKNKFFFFFNRPTANKQINEMIKRKIKVYDSNFFFVILKKALKYWNKKDFLFDIAPYSIQGFFNRSFNNIDPKYDGPRLCFTQNEKEKGENLLAEFGLKKNEEWICIHNRDSLYLARQFPKNFFSYHDYRNFSIQDLKASAEFFANKGYFVFRVGNLQREKLETNNSKIIDYANSKLKSDFLDIYLLAKSKFYLGSSSGPMNLSVSFKRPAYGVNYSFPRFVRSHIPYMFIFKRIKNLENGRLLNLKEILTSNFVEQIQNNKIKDFNHAEINNPPEEMSLLSSDILKEINGEEIFDKDDVKIQKDFWSLYKKYAKKGDLNLDNLKISPNFLKKNIDLLS